MTNETQFDYIGIKGLMNKTSLDKELKESTDDMNLQELISEEEYIKEIKEMDNMIQDMKNTRSEINLEKSKRMQETSNDYLKYINNEFENEYIANNPNQYILPSKTKITEDKLRFHNQMNTGLKSDKTNASINEYETIKNKINLRNEKTSEAKKKLDCNESEYVKEYLKMNEETNLEYEELMKKYSDSNVESMIKSMEDCVKLGDEIDEYIEDVLKK